MKYIVTEYFEERVYEDIPEPCLHRALITIAELCIENKWSRKDGQMGFHFTPEIKEIVVKAMGDDLPDGEEIDGYSFLDEGISHYPDGKWGFIRLWYLRSNPKWSFTIEDGVISIGDA